MLYERLPRPILPISLRIHSMSFYTIRIPIFLNVSRLCMKNNPYIERITTIPKILQNEDIFSKKGKWSEYF